MTPKPKIPLENDDLRSIEFAEYSLAPMAPVLLKMCPAVCLSSDQFFDLCQQNDWLRLERDAKGDIVIMAPEGGGSASRDFSLIGQFSLWVLRDGTGQGFGSSAGFNLPNGATRSPDLSWILKERLATLPDAVKEKFIPLCPDFVVEIRSPTDSLTALKAKMEEYRDNGARLGWLIDPFNRTVWVYRPGLEAAKLENPRVVSGDPELPGLTIEMQGIFDLRF